ARLRSSGWIDLPLKWNSDGTAVTLQITPADGAVIDFDYAEVFPERFGLVASPGSGVFADGDHLVFELPRSHKLDKVKLDGVDITARMTDLLASGKAMRTNTAYRTLIEAAISDLASDRMDRSELELRSSLLAARMQMLRAPTPCKFEGDTNG